tara:strand:- start:587 stop:1048 length:462 start_codon:yes stop_codon:yes gene_type:complete
MKPYYRKATVRDGALVAKNIREEDLREIEGIGHNPNAIPLSVLISEPCVAFFNHKHDICGVAGIAPDPRPNVGQIWMICTPALQENPQTFVKQAKRWLSEQREHHLLWNLVDTRNHYHLKLLKLLGFTFIRTVPTGPNNLPYIEIVKLCASQP